MFARNYMHARLRFHDRAVCVVAVGRSGGCFSLSRFDIDLAGTRPLAYAVCSCLKFRLDHPICQCAWLLCVGVEDPSPSLALMETWRVRPLAFVAARNVSRLDIDLAGTPFGVRRVQLLEISA